MRWFLTTALALQQLPALVHGLPIPPHGEQVGSTSGQITLRPAPDTQPEIPALPGAVADEDADKGAVVEPEGLEVQWAEPENDVADNGGQPEVASAGAAETDGDDDEDEDAWPSLTQTFFRKAKHAMATISNSDVDSPSEDDGDDDYRPALSNQTFPLLRRPNEIDTDSTDPEDTPDCASGLEAIELPFLKLLLVFLVLIPVVHLVAVHAFGYGMTEMPSESLTLPLYEGRAQRRGFWERLLGGCGGGCCGRGQRRGKIRLEDSDGSGYGYGYGYEYTDEKKGWSEKDGGLFQDDDERGDEAEYGYEGESDDESTLGDEIASFRAALEMVDGIVAAEERRTARSADSGP